MKRNKSVINGHMSIKGPSVLAISFFNQWLIQEPPTALQRSCPLLLMSWARLLTIVAIYFFCKTFAELHHGNFSKATYKLKPTAASREPVFSCLKLFILCSIVYRRFSLRLSFLLFGNLVLPYAWCVCDVFSIKIPSILRSFFHFF